MVKVLGRATGDISGVQFEVVRNLSKREAVDKQKQGLVKEVL